MTTHRIITTAVLSFFLLVFSANAGISNNMIFKISAAAGYTAVNFEKASGYPDDHLEDWDQFNYSGSLQGLFTYHPGLRFGGEIGYDQLYYWYYRLPYDLFPVYREHNWATLFISGIGQVFLTRQLYASGGADFHFFGSTPVLGISAGLGAEFKLGAIAVPLELRIKPIFGDGMPTVFQISTGIMFGAI